MLYDVRQGTYVSTKKSGQRGVFARIDLNEGDAIIDEVPMWRYGRAPAVSLAYNGRAAAVDGINTILQFPGKYFVLSDSSVDSRIHWINDAATPSERNVKCEGMFVGQDWVVKIVVLKPIPAYQELFMYYSLARG